MKKVKLFPGRKPPKLVSECGRYRAERDKGDTWYKLYDAGTGELVGDCTYWSNRYTNTHFGFETGFGDTKAVFSYPRHPRWFRRRWVSCFDIWIDDLANLVNKLGGQTIVAYKPDMNCHCHIGFRADAMTLRKIDKDFRRRKLDFDTRKKPGQWDINCPTTEVQPHA